MQDTKIFDLDAGVDCLAFANTLGDRLDPQPTEGLEEYADLVAFSEQTGQLPSDTAVQLRNLGQEKPSAARDVLVRARAVRETIYTIFSAVAAGNQPDAAALDALNEELGVAMAQSRVLPGPNGVEWTWASDPLRLDRPLWPVVRSAAELLTSGEEDRIRECAAHDCGWLFFDESRNRTRRWCSMQTCGNRAKVDRFRARRRGTDIVDSSD